MCPLEELSTSDTPESAGLGGNEPEKSGETSGLQYVKEKAQSELCLIDTFFYFIFVNKHFFVASKNVTS